MAVDALDLEMAVTMPWTVAEGGSMWMASGRNLNGGTFEDCLLRCVPEELHGCPGMRLFEALRLASGRRVPMVTVELPEVVGADGR